MDPLLISEYLDGMADIDPTVQYLMGHPGQAIVHDGLFISEREKDRHAYYDWHHRFTDMRFRLVGQTSPTPHLQAGVALHRARQAGAYEQRDIDRFTVLHRHLERALALAFRLGTLGTMQAAAFDVLDRNPTAMFLLDEHLRVVQVNHSAARLCEAGDGIRLAGGSLTLQRKPDDERLRRLLAEARGMRTALVSGPASTGLLRVSRPSGKRAHAILVAPVGGRPTALAAVRPADTMCT